MARTNRYHLLVIALIVSTFPSHLNGAGRLSAPVASSTVARDFGNKPIPKWENGYLVAFDNDEMPARVFAFSRTGTLVTEAKLSIPGAERVMLTGVAASPSGVLAASGTAQSEGGASAAFIAWISPSGAVQRVVRTSPFAAFWLCFDSNETLWVFGREVGADGHARTEPQHDVLRRYDGEGRFLGSLLARDSFPRYDQRHPVDRGFLVSSNDRVGLYSTAAREWVEVSLSGAILGRWKGADIGADFRITGVGIAADESVYLTVVPRSKGSRTTFYTLDKQPGAWLPVDSAQALGSGQLGYILGTDRDLLVLRAAPGLVWTRPE
jgi:hypothetical protein